MFSTTSHLLTSAIISVINCETFQTFKGVFVNSNPMKIVHVVSVLTCTQKCVFQKTCKGVNYNKHSHDCKIFSEIGHSSSNSEWDFYRKDEADNMKVNGCNERFYISQPTYAFCYDCDVHWRLLKKTVCFGAYYNDFATVLFNQSTHICGLRLKYKNGYIDCGSKQQKVAGRYWICEGFRTNFINYIITDKSKNVIFPKNVVFGDGMWYVVDEEIVHFDVLEFSSYGQTVVMEANSEMQIWFGEDLSKRRNTNNRGELCVDVYAGVI